MKTTTFTNKCIVPEWMPEYKKKFREEADQYFTNALEQVPFLKDSSVEVTYFLQGVGSIVAKIVSDSANAYVMKTTESFNHTSNEICTYKATADMGIKVPKLFFDGVQDELPFFLMEYFDTGTLADKLKNNEITIEEIAQIKNKFFCDVKKIEGKGYAWSISYINAVLQGNFKDINEYVDKWFGDRDFIEIAHKHMPNISWEKEFKYHADKIKEENDTTCKLGIFDFQNDHVFVSNPPTMFDMCLKLEPEYFDLAQLIIPFPESANETTIYLIKSTFKEYKKNFGEIDIEKLTTAVWLNSYRKATNQLKHSDERRMKNGLHILGIISDKKVLREYIKSFVE